MWRPHQFEQAKPCHESFRVPGTIFRTKYGIFCSLGWTSVRMATTKRTVQIENPRDIEFPFPLKAKIITWIPYLERWDPSGL